MNQAPIKSAGKLHLLDLAQLKARIGDKWLRLSSHVEKFFEVAIRRSLGPGDTFSRIDELTYLVLFRDLSLDEARLKCAVISEEVCQRLFGEQGAQASLRNLVVHVDAGTLPAGDQRSAALDALLEREGKETIVLGPGTERAPDADMESSHAMLRLRFSDDGSFVRRVSMGEVEYLYRPIWDAAKQIVVTYICQPTLRSRSQERVPNGFCIADNENDQATLDLLVLQECAAHTKRLRSDGLRILAAVPISFATVANSRLWFAYAEVRRKIPVEIARDLASVVVGIGRGVPNIRLGQELPKLSSLTRHVYCVVDDGGNAGLRFARTGARAVGIVISPEDHEIQSIERIKKLGQETQGDGLDAFALGIQSTSLALAAVNAGVRYLEGPAIRPASADPRHAFAQSLEYLYLSKLASDSPASVA